MRHSCIVAAVTLASTSTLACTSTARAETVVLSGATVLPQEGPAIPDARVVIHDGVIRAVGPRATTPVPGGARELAVTGFLVPGLIDVHAHVADPDVFGRLFLAHGVTTIRDLGNQLDHVTGFRDSVRAGKRPGPDVVFVGPILDGSPAVWPSISEVVTEPEHVRPLLARLKASGVQAFKVYENLEPEVYDAILVEARKLDVPVVGHVPRKVGAFRCVEAGQRVIEHLDDFAGALRAGPAEAGLTGEITGWTRIDEARERDLIELLLARKTALDPTRLVVERYSHLIRGIAVECPEARLVPADLREGFWRIIRNGRAAEPVDRAHEDGLARALAFVTRAHAAGVPILAGSDTPNPYLVPGLSLAEEVDRLARAIGPEEALRSATVVNARALGLDDRGVIAAGRRADLLLVAEDPRRDARGLARPALVVANGRVLARADLDRLLDEVAARTKALDERPVTGWASVEGPLLEGATPLRPEVRLEGRLGTFPVAHWARLAEFPREGGTVRVLRSQGSLPLPARTEETLELDPRGNVVRLRAARELAGQRTEAVATRGETTWRIELARAGADATELVVPLDEHLVTAGELLLAHLVQSVADLPEGASRDVPVRLIDLDRLQVGDRQEWIVRRAKNPVADAGDPRAGGRYFFAKGPTAELGKIGVWVDEHGDVLGIQVDLAIGTFVSKRPKPAKKRYH